MKTFTKASIGAAFGLAMLGLGATSSAQAAPLGAGVFMAGQTYAPVEQVQVRRRAPRRVVRRGRGGSDAALAAGLVGAAIVGGAIIAQSQRSRDYEQSYYYGQPQGYGYYADPYGQPVYTPPRRRYVDPGYYQQYGYTQPSRPRHHHTVRDPAGGGRLQHAVPRADNFYMP